MKSVGLWGLCLLMMALVSPAAVAQPTPAPAAAQAWRMALLQPVEASGEASGEASEVVSVIHRPQVVPVNQPRPRSVAAAFGLSAAVPGLGQAYNRQWVKAAVAIGLEVALWTGYAVWRNQGLDGEDAFQDYAHAHWDPTRYAAWLNDYRGWLEAEQGRTISAAAVEIPTGIDFQRPETWSPAQRDVVRIFFDQIRTLESDRGVVHPETGAAFSHKLPYFSEQQYYELIGKYFQFAPGWGDYPDWLTDGAPNGAIDPERTGPNGEKVNIDGRFLEYAEDHANANDLLRRSSRLTALVIVNHVLSAADAAFTARLHNLRFDTDVRVGMNAWGEVQPTAALRVSF
ncbi:MAG: DUF5683 domain-containing protein [Bacteroidota bacterium]